MLELWYFNCFLWIKICNLFRCLFLFESKMYSEKCSIVFVCIIYWYNLWFVVNIFILVEFILKRVI